MHLQCSSCTYAKQEEPWEATFEELPADITAGVPVPMIDSRVMGFWDTEVSHLNLPAWSVTAARPAC